MDKKTQAIFNDVKKNLLKFNFKMFQNMSLNEAQTRCEIIEPLFEIFGYSRPDAMLTELSAAWGKSNTRADIGLFVDNKKETVKPEIIVECKRFDKKLTDKEGSQLNNYFVNTPSAKIGILTNGIEWRVYTIDVNSKDTILQPVPFIEFSLNDIQDDVIEKCLLINRQLLSANIKAFLDSASDYFFKMAFKEALFQELKDPSDDFLRSVFRRMGNIRNTANSKDKMKAELNSNTMNEVVDKMIIEESKKSGNFIITTAEELKVYHAIKTILVQKKEIIADRISYRDLKNSFIIIVDGNQQKMICRLIINSKQKTIEIGSRSYPIEGIESIVKLKKDLIESAKQFFNSPTNSSVTPVKSIDLNAGSQLQNLNDSNIHASFDNVVVNSESQLYHNEFNPVPNQISASENNDETANEI